jgi:hypothetical protein
MLQRIILIARPTLDLKQTEFGRLALSCFFWVSVLLCVLLFLNAFSKIWSLLDMPSLDLKQTEFGNLALSYFFGIASLVAINALLLSWFVFGLIVFCALTLIALYFPMSKEQKEIDKKISIINTLKAASILLFEKILFNNILRNLKRLNTLSFFAFKASFNLFLSIVVSTLKIKRGIVDINLSSKLLPTPLLARA